MHTPLLGHSDELAEGFVQRFEQNRTLRPSGVVLDRHKLVSPVHNIDGEHAR
jgi:hypothetical protein